MTIHNIYLTTEINTSQMAIPEEQQNGRDVTENT